MASFKYIFSHMAVISNTNNRKCLMIYDVNDGRSFSLLYKSNVFSCLPMGNCNRKCIKYISLWTVLAQPEIVLRISRTLGWTPASIDGAWVGNTNVTHFQQCIRSFCAVWDPTWGSRETFQSLLKWLLFAEQKVIPFWPKLLEIISFACKNFDKPYALK